MKMFEKFRALISQPEEVSKEYEQTMASCAAMFRWIGSEERCQELLERWIATQKSIFPNETIARRYINFVMTIVNGEFVKDVALSQKFASHLEFQLTTR